MQWMALLFTAHSSIQRMALALVPDGAFIPPPNPPPTEFWGKTATGYSMCLLGETLDGMDYASPISFQGTDVISAYDRNKDDTHYYEALYGWLFNNSTESRGIVMNLGGNNQTINTQNLFPSGGTYQIMQAPIFSLIANPTNMNITNGTLSGNEFTVPPYSMVRFTASSIPDPPPATMTIAANGSLVLCSGDSVRLDAGEGYDHYLWSTGETTRQIWAKNEKDYWVRAYPEPFGYCASDTVHVKVNQRPDNPNIVPTGNKKFCNGGSIGFELGFMYDETGLTFYWPLTGDVTPSIVTGIGGGHYLVVTDENGCTCPF
jgi:hypothetical protein